jgi:hypothetical protein
MSCYIKFPDELIAVPGYPGYVWSIDEQALYSYKSGVLHKMHLEKPTRWNKYKEGYRVSKNGVKRKLSVRRLQTLTPTPITVKYENE